MRTEATETSRTETRLRIYRKTLSRAFLLSVSLHLLGALAVNPSLFLWILSRQVWIGYPGRSHAGDLAPQGEPREKRISLVRARRFTGPISLVEAEVVGTNLDLHAVDARAPSQAGAYGIEGAPETPARGRPRAGGSGSSVVIELDEDWAVVPGSGDIARSEKFQTLKIVRPEYPTSAIRAGIEGVVRLEVHVDSLGKVVGVQTKENLTASRELEDAAVHAMFLWEFRPYKLNSRPVPFTVVVPFRYRLVD